MTPDVQPSGLEHAAHGQHDVIEYEGDSVIIDRKQMRVGQRYPVKWRGENVFAVKNADGEVEFWRERPA